MSTSADDSRPGERVSGGRAQLPRTGPGPYAVADGRVLTDGLEVVVAAHCNLRCRACAYLSPVMPPMTVPPTQIERDLSALARYFHASEARVLGGEPLLHPELVSVLKAIRASGVSDTIRIVTNGLLLARMPAGFWQLADEVSVSVYPGRHPGEDVIAVAARMAEKHGVRLRMKCFRYFRESYSELGTRNAPLVERIYRTCQMANVWRCNTVLTGHLYRCPQSAFLASIIHETGPGGGPPEGLPITNSPGFARRLLEFLESPEPLGACANCLGSVGRLFRHGQTPRPEWRTQQQHHTEELVDWEHLDTLERNPGALVRDTSFLPAPIPPAPIRR
ncbi:MAG TPA: radical SAM protein [Streptosporangiaceae bacterium]|nr:radical SAM protein [Streptosporangiaceae bacterium]